MASSLAVNSAVASYKLTKERGALGVATVLTAVGLYSVPSWVDSLADPCVQAAIISAFVLLLLYATRWFGETGILIERIVLAFFLAGMPVIYIQRWFLDRAQSGEGWLAIEVLGFVVYGALAWVGFKRSPWFLAGGIAAHGIVWDLAHLHSAYIPSWYAIACLVVDIGLGLYIAARIPAWKAAGRTRS
jgi:hypothetical protein